MDIDGRHSEDVLAFDGLDFSSRPRERLERAGAASLADEELMALVFRTGGVAEDAVGLARACLLRCGGLRGVSQTSAQGLQDQPGLGPAKAASLQAAFELGRRVAAVALQQGQPISSPLDVHRAFLPWIREQKRESFQVLLLDARHRLLSLRMVSLGTLTASLVHPREVFRPAIREAAAAVVVLHNHPSGDPRPSAEDREVTRRLLAAGELLGIQLLDHVIVAEGGYFSFREELGGALIAGAAL